MAVVHLSSPLVMISLIFHTNCEYCVQPSCVVKNNTTDTHNCSIIIPVSNYCDCNKKPAQRYLEHSEGSSGVEKVHVTSKSIENGTLYISLDWNYRPPAEQNILKGFLLQMEIITSFIRQQYIIVEHKSKAATSLQLNLDNIQITKIKALASIKFSVWTVKRQQTRKLKTDNRDICRVFAEKYEGYHKEIIYYPNKQSNKAKASSVISKTPRHIIEQKSDFSVSSENSCTCLRNVRLNVITNTTLDIWILFGNSCVNQMLSIEPMTGQLWNPTTTKNGTQCENNNCCIRFADVPDGDYVMKVLYKCLSAEKELSQACSLLRNVTVTRPLQQHRSSMESVDEDNHLLAYVIVPVVVTFCICACVLFLILRKKKKQQSEDIELPLLQRKVLFISCITDSSSTETEAANEFKLILGGFGVQTTYATDIFETLYANNDIEYLANLKVRLDEEVRNYRHFVFITTKDLYESYKNIGRVTKPVRTVNSTDHDWHHYLLAGQIITYLRQEYERQEGICHFVALEESALKYQQKISSFVKLPRGRCRRYCLSKTPKFNLKDFNDLLQSLPTSLQNNELVEKMETFDSTQYLQILKRDESHKPDPMGFHEDNQTEPKLSTGDSCTGSTVVKSCIDNITDKENSTTTLMPDKNNANNSDDIKTSSKRYEDDETMEKVFNSNFDHTAVKDAAETGTTDQTNCTDVAECNDSDTTSIKVLVHSSAFHQSNLKSSVDYEDDCEKLSADNDDVPVMVDSSQEL